MTPFPCFQVDDTVYPVNAIAFHPIHGTFATGGCDGSVVLWDARQKKRLAALPRLATSVSALAFSRGKDGGDLLAVAQSYTFEEGEKVSCGGSPLKAIYFRCSIVRLGFSARFFVLFCLLTSCYLLLTPTPIQGPPRRPNIYKNNV